MTQKSVIIISVLLIMIVFSIIFFVLTFDYDVIPSSKYYDASHISKEICISSNIYNWNEMINTCECDVDCQLIMDMRRLDYTPANTLN